MEQSIIDELQSYSNEPTKKNKIRKSVCQKRNATWDDFFAAITILVDKGVIAEKEVKDDGLYLELLDATVKIPDVPPSMDARQNLSAKQPAASSATSAAPSSFYPNTMAQCTTKVDDKKKRRHITGLSLKLKKRFGQLLRKTVDLHNFDNGFVTLNSSYNLDMIQNQTNIPLKDIWVHPDCTHER